MIEFQTRDVTTRGVRLSVLTGGQADGAPMMFLHGLRDVAWSLAPIASHFADRFAVSLPHLRGHGDSDKPGVYTFEHYIHDLYEVVQAVCPEPPVIVGHSLGGQIAARFAAVFPEHVRRLVLLEGLGPPELPVLAEPAAALAMYRARLLDRFADRPRSRGMDDTRMAAERLQRNNPRMQPEMAELLAEKATYKDADGRLRWNFDHHAGSIFVGGNKDDGPSFWQHVQCKALVISGDLSYEYWSSMIEGEGYTGRYGDGEMDARAAIMPKGRHVPFHHSGHMVQFDEPERVIEEIEAFLQEED